MRVLSALDHEYIEGYLGQLQGISRIVKVNCKKALLEAIDSHDFGLVFISKDLPGSEKMEALIEVLAAKGEQAPRIIFLYGEQDCRCDDFVRLLIDNGIYDFFVGEEVTSQAIEKLVYVPSSREKAIGYFSSSYDNAKYYSSKKNNMRSNGFILGSTSLLGNSLRTVIKRKWREATRVDKLVISVISNHSTGKSHTAWNLAHCLAKHGYNTSIFNIDRGYSANLFFDIDELYHSLLDFTTENNKHKDILNNCWKAKNLNVIAGKLGEEAELAAEDFIKLLYGIRTKSDITLIDTRTGLTPITKLAVKSSTYDLMIFDCDLMHYHMNMRMLEELKEDFIPEKTIAVINNTNIKASCNKFIYNELKRSGICFKGIASIGACGLLSCELMHTGIAPYNLADDEMKDFRADMDSLYEKLCTKY